MKYLIKSQREGLYFTGFTPQSNSSCFGKIQDAQLYGEKYTALKDLRKMDQCGQRIVAVTRVGKTEIKSPEPKIK